MLKITILLVLSAILFGEDVKCEIYFQEVKKHNQLMEQDIRANDIPKFKKDYKEFMDYSKAFIDLKCYGHNSVEQIREGLNRTTYQIFGEF